MVPEANDIMKSSAMAGEAKGSDWRLEVEFDQRKLGH
jgi:hypothetical protein